MTNTDPRPRTAWRITLACAVLVAAAAGGFLVRHSPSVPKGTSAVDWSAVCRGRDGEDMRRLLGDSATAQVDWSGYGSLGAHGDDFTEEQCSVTGDRGRVQIRVRSLEAAEVREAARTAGRPFTAGDFARAQSAGAFALVTCRRPHSAPMRLSVQVTLKGAAAHRTGRGPVVEHLTRAWAKAVETEKNCGAWA